MTMEELILGCDAGEPWECLAGLADFLRRPENAAWCAVGSDAWGVAWGKAWGEAWHRKCDAIWAARKPKNSCCHSWITLSNSSHEWQLSIRNLWSNAWLAVLNNNANPDLTKAWEKAWRDTWEFAFENAWLKTGKEMGLGTMRDYDDGIYGEVWGRHWAKGFGDAWPQCWRNACSSPDSVPLHPIMARDFEDARRPTLPVAQQAERQ